MGIVSVRNVSRNTVLGDQIVLADKPKLRRRGLLGKDELEPGEGIWLVPCEAVHTVGMRFSIDLIYLDRALRVRKIRESVVPYRISACLRAHSTLELPAGRVRDTHTAVGDLLEFSGA